MLPFAIENLEQDSFVRLLDYMIEEIGIKNAVFSEKVSMPGKGLSAPQPRFDFVLSGIKHLRYPCRSCVVDGMLPAGTVHFNPPFTPKEPCWDSVHDMSSVVIYHDYLRMTYISVPKPLAADAPMGAKCWYHTHRAPNESIIQMCHLLASLAGTPQWDVIAPEQILLLLKLVRQEIKGDSHTSLSKKEITWAKLFYYLQDNFMRHISREQIGRELNLCPGYISELIVERTGQSFVSYMTRLRMERASSLLLKTDVKLEDITWRCGYESVTYFCAAFKRYYGVTPSTYRNKRQQPTPGS